VVDLHAEGKTDLGQAFALLAEETSNIPADARIPPPQIVLISDGNPRMTGREHCKLVDNPERPVLHNAEHWSDIFAMSPPR
jgi:Mg-chelatase subunit ChlD